MSTSEPTYARQVLAIAAIDHKRTIGFHGKLPWHVPADLKHFAMSTAKQAVLMGRTTWESLEPKYRPLPGRSNIVISRKPEALKLPAGVIARSDCEQVIAEFRSGHLAAERQQLWIIGGAQIYAATLHLCDQLVLSLIPGEHQGDTFFPPFENLFVEQERTPIDGCVVIHYRRAVS